MKKIINAIKNYMKNYNEIQSEMLRIYGANYLNAQMFANTYGVAAFY